MDGTTITSNTVSLSPSSGENATVNLSIQARDSAAPIPSRRLRGRCCRGPRDMVACGNPLYPAFLHCEVVLTPAAAGRSRRHGRDGQR
jgi:hypothetical protein